MICMKSWICGEPGLPQIAVVWTDNQLLQGLKAYFHMVKKCVNNVMMRMVLKLTVVLRSFVTINLKNMRLLYPTLYWVNRSEQ